MFTKLYGMSGSKLFSIIIEVFISSEMAFLIYDLGVYFYVEVAWLIVIYDYNYLMMLSHVTKNYHFQVPIALFKKSKIFSIFYRSKFLHHDNYYGSTSVPINNCDDPING
jgi:hypothetical protein